MITLHFKEMSDSFKLVGLFLLTSYLKVMRDYSTIKVILMFSPLVLFLLKMIT
jgi:hypothetical protein